MKTATLAFCLSLVALCASAANDAFVLNVEVHGGIADRGQILASLFNFEETYMSEPFADTSAPVDSTGRASLNFPNLPPGEYALSVIYDEDGDGELDTGFLGIPQEAFGFSNDAKARFGPPPYEEARFSVSEQNTNISINLDAAE